VIVVISLQLGSDQPDEVTEERDEIERSRVRNERQSGRKHKFFPLCDSDFIFQI